MKNLATLLLVVLMLASCKEDKALVIAPSTGYSKLVDITIENNTPSYVIVTYKHAGIEKQIELSSNQIYTGLILEKDSLSVKVSASLSIDKDKFNYIVRPAN